MTKLSRRALLQSAALLGGAPCLCLADASRDCCAVPEAPAAGVGIHPGLLTIDLTRVPDLHTRGASQDAASGHSLTLWELPAGYGFKRFFEIVAETPSTHLFA